MHRAKWTQKDDETLIHLYCRENISLKELTEFLPERTVNAIHARAQKLGLSGPKFRMRGKQVGWNDLEVAKLKTLWEDPKTTLDQVKQAFPYR